MAVEFSGQTTKSGRGSRPAADLGRELDGGLDVVARSPARWSSRISVPVPRARCPAPPPPWRRPSLGLVYGAGRHATAADGGGRQRGERRSGVRRGEHRPGQAGPEQATRRRRRRRRRRPPLPPRGVDRANASRPHGMPPNGPVARRPPRRPRPRRSTAATRAAGPRRPSPAPEAVEHASRRREPDHASGPTIRIQGSSTSMNTRPKASPDQARRGRRRAQRRPRPSPPAAAARRGHGSNASVAAAPGDRRRRPPARRVAALDSFTGVHGGPRRPWRGAVRRARRSPRPSDRPRRPAADADVVYWAPGPFRVRPRAAPARRSVRSNTAGRIRPIRPPGGRPASAACLVDLADLVADAAMSTAR